MRISGYGKVAPAPLIVSEPEVAPVDAGTGAFDSALQPPMKTVRIKRIVFFMRNTVLAACEIGVKWL
jgi:hypothetical protein